VVSKTFTYHVKIC